MCMLTYLPPQTQPDTEALLNGAWCNDDGHGFAIVTGRRVLVRRSMHAERLVAEFAALRERYPQGPALFHSRLGTHGTLSLANCHPFQVGDARTVLAHNGILPRSMQPRPQDSRCDTRVAAEDVLAAEPDRHLGTSRGRSRLARRIGTRNKLLILTADPRFSRPAYLINEASGVWDDGCWYSNTDYLQPPIAVPADAAPHASSWCARCECAESADLEIGLCLMCGACIECAEISALCGCYVPARHQISTPDALLT